MSQLFLQNIEEETDTTLNVFFTKVYYISAGQTSLLQVQCKFYIGRVLCSIFPEYVKLFDSVN